MDDCMDEELPDKTPAWLAERRKEQGLIVGPTFSRDLVGPDNDDRALVADVAFNRHSMNDGHHVSPSDNGMIQVGTDGIRVELVQGIEEETFKKTLTAAVRATIGLDLSQPLPGTWEHCDALAEYDQHHRGESVTDYGLHFKCDKHEEHTTKVDGYGVRTYVGKVPMNDWEEMLKGGLQTALETQVIVFAVSGVSRTCTHQLVRTRKAGFHQQSQRASYQGDAPELRMPESVWKNRKARHAFFRSAVAAWRAYREICEEDISYQDARYVLPEGTTSFILLEYTVREFLNVYAYRGCSMFQWEIVQVMRDARKVLVEAHPWLDPYVKISCEKTGPAIIPTKTSGTETVDHHCTFQGWENVEGQCDFAWAREEARTFKPQFHKIERNKEKS